MRRRVVAVLVVLAALAALFFWWRRRPHDPSHPRAGAGAAGSAAPDDPLARRRAARAAGQVDAPRTALAGRVIDADSRAGIAGATVAIAGRTLDGGARIRPGETPEPLVATTAADGGFRIEGLLAGRYSASASASGYAGAVVDPIDLGGASVPVVIALRRGGNRLSGTVSDIQGGPIADALVRATRFDEAHLISILLAPVTTRSDDAGRYEMLLGDGFYLLSVVHPDYVDADRQTELRGGPRVEDFTLTPGAMVEGRVLARGSDAPVAGALVTAGGDEMGGVALSGVALGPAAVTDPAGRFLLRRLQPGSLVLRAVGPGYASKEPTPVQLAIAEHATGVVIYVDRAFTISGIVVSKPTAADGATPIRRPLAGILVGAYNLSPGALHAATDPSAGDGWFEIHGVLPGRYTLGALGEERPPTLFGPAVSVVDRDVGDLVVELEAGVTLSGRVEPPSAAIISLSMDEDSIGLFDIGTAIGSVLTRGAAAADGSFALRGVMPGTFELVARSEDGREGRLPIKVAAADQQGLVVKLEPRGRIAGVVVDPAGAPVDGARVACEPVSGKQSPMATGNLLAEAGALSRADGSFELRGLADGGYRLTVEHSGAQLAWADPAHRGKRYEPIEVTVTGAGAVTGVRLVVEKLDRSIRGVVLGPDGAPLPDAWVTAHLVPGARPSAPAAVDEGAGDGSGGSGKRSASVSITIGGGGGRVNAETDDGKGGGSGAGDEAGGEAVPPERRQPPGGGVASPALTDAEGRFVIDELRDGTYDLWAEGLAGAARGAAFGVKAGGTATIRLRPLASITGVVSDRGAPVREYVVEAIGPTSRRTAVVRDDGAYALRRLEPGNYRLAVTSPRGRAAGEAAVRAGQTAELDLELVAWGSVRGRVVDAVSGKPMPGLVVVATTDEGTDYGEMAMEILQGGGPRTGADGGFLVGRLGAGRGQLYVVDADHAGFDLKASASFSLAEGQELDLGTLQGQAGDDVPKEERGDLGLTASVASWADRPRASGAADAERPADVAEEAELLWVSEVAADGPAAAAGLAVGDRIVAVGGLDVAVIGARVAEQSLAPRRVKAGAAVALVVDHEGSRTTVSVTARPAPAQQL